MSASFPSAVLQFCVLLNLMRLTTQENDTQIAVQESHFTADYSDCSDVAAHGSRSSRPPSGKYWLTVGAGRRGVWAYCDMETDTGGWTVIQRRSGPDVSFYRGWREYEQGFGDSASDHWIGNTYIHSLTVNKRYVLRIELTDWDGATNYAEYDFFVVGGNGCKYTLESLGRFCGDCGDSMEYHLGHMFSTYDQDNDKYGQNCAQMYLGAWWHNNCHASNLNGKYLIGNHASYANGINWKTGRGYHYSYKKVEMKIRPYNY